MRLLRSPRPRPETCPWSLDSDNPRLILAIPLVETVSLERGLEIPLVTLHVKANTDLRLVGGLSR